MEDGKNELGQCMIVETLETGRFQQVSIVFANADTITRIPRNFFIGGSRGVFRRIVTEKIERWPEEGASDYGFHYFH
jgi:hypothetical protein